MYLIFGATGLIGKKFVEELTKREQYHIVALRGDVDYNNFKDLDETVKISTPKAIINCAGLVGKPSVDACEKNKENVYKINVDFPRLLSKISLIYDIPLAHVSSGCIYTGKKQDGSGFSENDAPNFCFDSPLNNYYSGTKAEAEKQIRAITEKHYIWRPRVIFDELDNPKNYISRLLNDKKILEIENSISHLGDFVSACLDSLDKKIPFGTYNIVNSKPITTEAIIKKIKKILKIEKKFNFWESEEEFYKDGEKVLRSNCLLDNSKLLAAGIKMRDTEEALEEALNNWRKA